MPISRIIALSLNAILMASSGRDSLLVMNFGPLQSHVLLIFRIKKYFPQLNLNPESAIDFYCRFWVLGLFQTWAYF